MAFKDDGRYYPIAECPFDNPRTAGRMDLIAEIYGEWAGVTFDGTYIGDYKTGKKPHSRMGYPEWPLQLSLYREGAYRTLGVEADGQIIFHLDKFTGIPTPFDYSATHEDDFATAWALVEFYHLFKRETIASKGGDVPSVTTILKVLDKPALPQWAANCARDYMIEKVEEERIGTVPDAMVKDWAREAAKNFRKVSETAMDVGTRVHNLIEQFLVHEQGPSKSQLFDEQVRVGWEAFLEMWESLDTNVLHVEARIFV